MNLRALLDPGRYHRWCGGVKGHAHQPVAELYLVRWPGGLCGWRTVFTWHGRRRLWVCHHYERCEACGHVLRAELPAEDCPQFAGVAASPRGEFVQGA